MIASPEVDDTLRYLFTPGAAVEAWRAICESYDARRRLLETLGPDIPDLKHMFDEEGRWEIAAFMQQWAEALRAATDQHIVEGRKRTRGEAVPSQWFG